MDRKYEFTGEEKTLSNGVVLHRIRAVRDFSFVVEGELGGWIEKEENLSHEGDCWISENAQVFGYARVGGDAWVSENARVFENAYILENAHVIGSACVYGDAWVSENAEVAGKARVFENARVCGNAVVLEKAEVRGEALVCGYARISEYATVFGNARVYGYAEISSDADIESMRDYITFKNWWSSGRYFTWTRSNDKWRVGCFYGSGEALIKKAYQDSELSGREYERVVKYVEAIKEEYEKENN